MHCSVNLPDPSHSPPLQSAGAAKDSLTSSWPGADSVTSIVCSCGAEMKGELYVCFGLSYFGSTPPTPSTSSSPAAPRLL